MVSEDDKGKLLNSLMRSGDPQVRLNAIQLSDARREKQLEREKSEPTYDPIATLNELAKLSPFQAAWCARTYGLSWTAPAVSVDQALKELEAVRKFILADTAGELARPQAATGQRQNRSGGIADSQRSSK